MSKAIATLQSIIGTDTELIELKESEFWQKKLAKAIIDPISSTYIVLPQTITTLAEIVKLAHQQQWRVLICGNGTKLDWGHPAANINLVVSTQKCDRLIEHAVGDLTVTVEAGMKLAELQAKLQVHQQFLAIDPVYPQATIGGIIATADTGSWRQRYGGIRDMLLGISFVRADGKVAKAGGRVVKNVAGYDLMKLFAGAYGTLGIITQATFRTYPLPQASTTLLLIGNAESLTKAAQTIRNSSLTPTALDLCSAAAISQLQLGDRLGLLVRFQTIPESIERQSEQVIAIAKQANLTVSSLGNKDELWQKLTEIVRIPDTETAVIVKIGIVPTAVANLLTKLSEIAPDSLAMIYAGSGIGHIQLPSAAIASIQTVRSFCQNYGGYLTILSAPNAVKQQLDIWGYSGNAINVMKAIEQKFDPSHILNPGRFVGNI